MPVSLNVVSEVSGIMRGVHTIGVYMWRLRWLSVDFMTGVHTGVSLHVAFEVAGSFDGGCVRTW